MIPTIKTINQAQKEFNLALGVASNLEIELKKFQDSPRNKKVLEKLPETIKTLSKFYIEKIEPKTFFANYVLIPKKINELIKFMVREENYYSNLNY